MQLSKIKFTIVLVLALVLTFTSAVYSDSIDGWKGYGLYNINSAEISVINEDVSIELQNGKVIYSGEFLIRNYTKKAVKATLGMPALGIESIALTEKNTAVKWRKRTLGSLQNEFSIENRVPKENDWYVFSLTLNPGETKVLNIKLEAVALQEEPGAYTVSYYSDRGMNFSNKVEKSSLYIDVLDFQPYNLIDLQGVDPSQLGIKGDMLIKGENPNAVFLKYMDTTKTLIEKLSKSALYKPREIATAFNRKDYHKTFGLCDEYIKNPIDSTISAEDMQFVKAESIRRLQNSDRYLELVENMDYSKLYPLELKNKIYLERINIYQEQQNKEKLSKVLSEMEKDASQSTRILKKWVEGSSTFAAAQVSAEASTKEVKPVTQKDEQGKLSIVGQIDALMKHEYAPGVLFVAGLLLGFLLRGIRFNRRRKSRYIYRM